MIIKIEGKKIVDCFKANDTRVPQILADYSGRRVLYKDKDIQVILIGETEQDIKLVQTALGPLLYLDTTKPFYILFILPEMEDEEYYEEAMFVAKQVAKSLGFTPTGKPEDFLNDTILTYGEENKNEGRS